MKKVLISALCLFAFLAGCRADVPEPVVPAPPVTASTAATEERSPVMTHAEFLAAPLETPVVIETYVQAAQEWWDDTVTVYAQSEDGGYFLRNMACSQSDAALLVPGAHIRVTGKKVQWAGSDQIDCGAFTLLEGSYIAPTTDLSALLGSPALEAHQNEKAVFTGLTVEPANEAGDPFLYGWDGSGDPGGDSDLYFYASRDGVNCLFVIPYYLCGPTSDAYQTVITMKVGDTVTLEGFLYWYEGPQPHITSVKIG